MLQELFDAASELEPEAWSAFLERATPDTSLRRRVLELLESARRAGDFLRSPTLDASGNAIPDELPSRFAPGARIGPYEIVRRLGSGGSGIVFLARQSEPISREVALKLLRTAIEDEEPRWRFEVEKEAVSRMDHPGIARVLDAGLTGENRPWIAMEHVPGEPVTAWCDVRRLSIGERAALFADVCEAVHHAHQKGVIHRDLKPSNILVSQAPDGPPRPCVIDFGIARITGSASPLQTLPGRLPGTPAYMSPEQFAGNSAALDARSDIYSLGVILYELLAGASPFADALSTPRSAGPASRPPRSPSRLARTLADEERKRLAAHRGQSLRAWHLSLRGDLAAIALKCLEQEPARRYASADALAADLRAFVARRPVSARPPTAVYLARRFIRRRPIATASAAAVALGVAVATILVHRSEQRAVRERRNAEAERVRAQDLFTGFSQLILAGNPERGKPRDYPLHQAVIDFSRDLPLELRRDPLTEAHARHTLGHALFGMGETRQALVQYEAALALADRLPASRSQEFLPWLLYNTSLAVRDDPVRARSLLVRAEAEFAALPLEKHHRMRIRTLGLLAVLDADGNRLADAAATARRAVALAEALDPADPPLLAKSLWTLARVERRLDRPEEARRLGQRRLALLEASLGPDHPETWNARASLALDGIPGPSEDEALASLADIARKTAAHFGAAHLQTYHAAIDHARGLAAAGHCREAAEAFRAALDEARRHLPPGTRALEEWELELEGREK